MTFSYSMYILFKLIAGKNCRHPYTNHNPVVLLYATNNQLIPFLRKYVFSITITITIEISKPAKVSAVCMISFFLFVEFILNFLSDLLFLFF